MYCMMMQIPMNEFIEKSDKHKYVFDADFFDMIGFVKFNDIVDRLNILAWYNLYTNVPLYIYVMSDRYFFKTFKGTDIELQAKLSNWKTVPAYCRNIELKVLPEEYRLRRYEDTLVDEVRSKLSKNNYINNPLIEVYIEPYR